MSWCLKFEQRRNQDGALNEQILLLENTKGKHLSFYMRIFITTRTLKTLQLLQASAI